MEQANAKRGNPLEGWIHAGQNAGPWMWACGHDWAALATTWHVRLTQEDETSGMKLGIAIAWEGVWEALVDRSVAVLACLLRLVAQASSRLGQM
jgi:hypothetical protein